MQVFVSSFNAERFWKDENRSILPSFKDIQASTIVDAMDEMQFLFCKESDVSLTRFPMNVTHKDYLMDIGFTITNNLIPLEIDRKSDRDVSSCELIFENIKRHPELEILKLKTTSLDLFSIVPGVDELHQLLRKDNDYPNIKVVQKVNSKVYSTLLSEELMNQKRGIIVRSSEALVEKASQLLQMSSVIIKDPFGVSGSGNISINKESSLQSIAKYLRTQEDKGKVTELILEPLLDKDVDFSCQAYIDKNGNCKIHSVQIMDNDGFRFSGIKQADDEFVQILNREKYFERTELIMREMFKEGYYGPVCIDSMLLKNGTIIEIIEINARKSMGLLNHCLGTFMNNSYHGLKHKLMTLSLTSDTAVKFEALISQLQNESILFGKDSSSGIIPLSANTFDINRSFFENVQIKRRMYYALVYRTVQDYILVCRKLKSVCDTLALKIV